MAQGVHGHQRPIHQTTIHLHRPGLYQTRKGKNHQPHTQNSQRLQRSQQTQRRSRSIHRQRRTPPQVNEQTKTT